MKKITYLLVVFLSFSLAYAQPATNATTPTKAPADVFAIYNSSNTYTSTNTNLNPNWGQTGFGANDIAFTNGGTISPVIRYSNFNYQGLEIANPGVNVSNMEFIHLDIWSASLTSVRLVPIQPGVAEFGQNINITSSGAWISIDIPLAGYTGYSFGNIIQLKFDTAVPTNGLEFYVDNIYFWKNPVVSGTDANLSNLLVDGMTVPGFGSSVLNYTVQLPNGTSTIPQITATTSDVNATTVITQASALPGSGSVVVTSQNTAVTKTYTVNFVLTGPSIAAPTPPNRPAADVISLFSEAYANIGITEWSTSWDDSSVDDIMVAGNAVKKINFVNFLGVQLANYENATQLTNFHMDYFIDAGVDLTGKVINPKLSNHGAQAGETSALLLTHLPTTSGSWQSIDVPLSTFAGAQNRENFYQFLITSNIGTVYVDNIYLHKNTVLSNETFTTSKVNMYPNPTNNIVNINSIENIDSVSVMNVLGQTVMNKVVNSNDFTLDISELNSGQYFLNLNSNGVRVVKKLIKN